MTANYYPYDEEWEVDEWVSSYDPAPCLEQSRPGLPLDIITLAAAILVIMGLVFGLGNINKNTDNYAGITTTNSQEINELEVESPQPSLPVVTGPASIIAPYDQYILTQGIHGLSYGHMAIDIAAGKGVTIKSPISGVVSDYFFDAIGNPTLVIENDTHRVTMLHGNFTVAAGDVLEMGDPVGTEGNLGNTRDMQGRSCRGRDCGYHTHLNVFDKQEGTNINPLELISQ
jgi:hypothetical protein